MRSPTIHRFCKEHQNPGSCGSGYVETRSARYTSARVRDWLSDSDCRKEREKCCRCMQQYGSVQPDGHCSHLCAP